MSEIASATGIAVRNIQFLRENRLGPFATKDQAGGLYGEDTLAEVAMIAGCTVAGYALSLSAALVRAFLDNNRNHGAARWCFLDHAVSDFGLQRTTWLHHYFQQRAQAPNAGADLTAGHDQDQMLIVADRQYVLTGTKGKPRVPLAVAPGIDPYGPMPLGTMHDLVRGGDARFVPFEDEHVSWDKDAKGFIHQSAQTVGAEIAFQKAARDALALVTVNLSLAVRRAFDRVYELRQAKGGPFWTEGAS